MKQMKRSLGAALAVLLMILLLPAPFARGADLSGHTYTAYQVFSGTTDGGGIKDVQWGSGVDSGPFLTELKNTYFGGNRLFSACSTAQDVAKVMGEWADYADFAVSFSQVAYNHRKGSGTPCVSGTTTLPSGYYLVVDTTPGTGLHNLVLLQLTGKGTFEIRNKISVPTLVKKVRDVNDSSSAPAVWMDSADHDIGDQVPFRLTCTLGDLSGFRTYRIEFIDTLDSTFQFTEGSARVKIDGVDQTSAFTIRHTGGQLTAAPTNRDVISLGAHTGSVITLEYTALLTGNARLGAAGNVNTAYLKYSSDPNDSTQEEETPRDQVKVFTYAVVVNKVDSANNPLLGAAFQLYKQSASGGYELIDTIQGTSSSLFRWTGLDDGNYRLRESVTPTGYNPIPDIDFTISATHSEEADEPVLISLTAGNMFTGNVSTGVLSADVVNVTGATLPETGGRGTWVLYVGGAVLLIGAIVLLIVKRRKDDQD